MTAGPEVPGRVEVTVRALTAVARAVAAERLGAPAGRVRVGLADASGALALDIHGPIADGDDVVSRSIRVAEEVKERVGDLTGRRVGRAHIELTGIVRERVSRVD